jgi:DNA-binding SARP family transcriptional activator
MPDQAVGWNERPHASWRLQQVQQTERRNLPTWPIGGIMTPRTPLRLTLIERFALWRSSQELGIATSGQRLIALLALRNRAVGRLNVAGTLWPDYPTERSLADLRTALWRVNQASEQVIAATPSLLKLDTDVEVDVRNVTAFARRLSQAWATSPTVDLDTVSLPDLVGDLLPDWYEDWLQDEREGLRQTRLHALESLARRLSESGRHADAIQAALAALRLEPLRETAHHTLIEIHLAEGNRSEACRQFQRCRRLLREELGVEPSDSMRLLFEKRSSLPRFPAVRYAPSRRGAQTGTASPPESPATHRTPDGMQSSNTAPSAHPHELRRGQMPPRPAQAHKHSRSASDAGRSGLPVRSGPVRPFHG